MATTTSDFLPATAGQNLGSQSQTWNLFAGALTISGISITVGVGDPTGVISATQGSIYLRTDGSTSTTLYVKTSGGSGSSGWTAK